MVVVVSVGFELGCLRWWPGFGLQWRKNNWNKPKSWRGSRVVLRSAVPRPGFDAVWYQQVVASFGVVRQNPRSAKSLEDEASHCVHLKLTPHKTGCHDRGRARRLVAAGILRNPPKLKSPLGSGRTHRKSRRTLKPATPVALLSPSVHQNLANGQRASQLASFSNQPLSGAKV